jgi:Na+/melibiose symporter-like transporter
MSGGLQWLRRGPDAGIIFMLMIFAIFLTRSARQEGITSAGFFWTAVICAVVGIAALTVRWLRERRLQSPGQPQNRRQPSSSN